jgi:hypothetical protein
MMGGGCLIQLAMRSDSNLVACDLVGNEIHPG